MSLKVYARQETLYRPVCSSLSNSAEQGLGPELSLIGPGHPYNDLIGGLASPERCFCTRARGSPGLLGSGGRSVLFFLLIGALSGVSL